MSDTPSLNNPVHHAHDPASSAEAATRVTAAGTRTRHAAIVLTLVKQHPDRTAIELMSLQAGPVVLDEYQIRRRLTDRLLAGAVEQGQVRACCVRGSRMVTWRATTGRTELSFESEA